MVTVKTHPNSHNARNQFYETDLEEDIRLIRWLMKSVGLWSSKSENSSQGNLISFIVCTLVNVAVVVPFFVQLFFIEEDVRKQVESVPPFIGFIIGEAKYFCILNRKRDVCSYIDRISEDWRNARMKPDREIMLQSGKFCRQLTRTCMIIMYTGTVSYAIIVPHLSGESDKSNNVTTRKLSFPCYYYVFDVSPSPNYEIIYVVQITCVVVTITLYSVACALTAKLVFHICAQCRIVRSLFKNIIDGDGQQDLSFNERWSYAIKAHLRVLRFVNDVVSVLKGICLTELLGCSTVACFVGFDVILNLQENNVGGFVICSLIFISYILNLFVYCFISEQLTHQCSVIGEAAYEIDWYRLPPRKASEIILILAICNVPVKLTAGKVSELSMTVFCDVSVGITIFLCLT
ncbi:putative odorant receptor 85d [Orussus abietinus]|uniref:putative odorant receptor 85d n=1 Tax=Orussus abietinus TaxID=222816 RepID=UPI000C715EA7|nr:putative odorant receptor 85d [Orussus abietinus]